MSNLQVLSRRELADLLHITPRTVARWAKEGRIPPPLRPGGRRALWSRAAIEQWLAQSHAQAQAAQARAGRGAGKSSH